MRKPCRLRSRKNGRNIGRIFQALLTAFSKEKAAKFSVPLPKVRGEDKYITKDMMVMLTVM